MLVQTNASLWLRLVKESQFFSEANKLIICANVYTMHRRYFMYSLTLKNSQ